MISSGDSKLFPARFYSGDLSGFMPAVILFPQISPQQRHFSYIIVTHNIEEAVFLGRRIIVLDNGIPSIKTIIKINREITLSFRSLGGTRWGYYLHIVWPVSLPGIFTSLRIGTGTPPLPSCSLLNL